MNRNIIEMQFPYDSTSTNKSFDGQIHKIIPMKLLEWEIDKFTFYIVSYFDYNTECDGIALLTRIKDVIVNFPLTNYDLLDEYIKRHELKDADLNLPNYIYLGEMLNDELFFKSVNKFEEKPAISSIISVEEKEFVLMIDNYIPLNRKVKNLSSTTFISSGIHNVFNDKTISFLKDVSLKTKDSILRDYLPKSKKNGNGIYYNEIELEIPEGYKGNLFAINSQSNQAVMPVYLLPGKRLYKVFFFKCNDYELFLKYKKSLKIDVEVFDEELLDSYDSVFDDGINGDSSVIFYNAQGEKIDL